MPPPPQPRDQLDRPRTRISWCRDVATNRVISGRSQESNGTTLPTRELSEASVRHHQRDQYAR